MLHTSASYKDSYTRLFEKVVVNNDTDCWEWIGFCNSSGYGRIAAADMKEHFKSWQKVYVHRYSYTVHRGAIPECMEVRHMCHNKRCVNPEHLELGTSAENKQDSVDAKRINTQKLSSRDVEDLRALQLKPKPGHKTRPKGSVTALARKYGVGRRTIEAALNGKTFKRVKVDHA